MNLLIDINHPGQVYLFSPIAKRILEEGGNVLCTARDKDVTLHLLRYSQLPFTVCSRRGHGLLSLFYELIHKTYRILKIAKDFSPDAILSLGSPPAAWAAALLGRPHIALEDTEHSIEQAILYLPFTQKILTSIFFERNLGKKQIRYNGFHELAYLHPHYFEPDKRLVTSAGIDADAPYSVVRFVSWQASHDIGKHGLSPAQKQDLISMLAKLGPVVLTSEAPLPPNLLRQCILPSAEKIHHFLAFARLYIGEGATMASEAVMLGTPAIYTNPLSAGTLKAQERFGLLHHITDFDAMMVRARHFMQDDKKNSVQLRNTMLKNMDDLTEIIWQTLKDSNHK